MFAADAQGLVFSVKEEEAAEALPEPREVAINDAYDKGWVFLGMLLTTAAGPEINEEGAEAAASTLAVVAAVKLMPAFFARLAGAKGGGRAGN